MKGGECYCKIYQDLKHITKLANWYIKLTDENNNEKEEFSQNEKFKVLVPIKQAKEKQEFNISVQTKVETKPILYGRAPDSSYQDYALTGVTYEDGTGNAKDEYIKNKTTSS